MKKILIIICILFSSCFHRIHEGVVVNRYIVPEHTYQYTTFIYTGKIMVPIQHTAYAETEYILTVEKSVKGERIREDFSVDYNTYECKTISTYFFDTVKCEVYISK